MIKLGVNDDWSNLIEKFLNLDIYYSQGYVNLFADVEGGSPEAVYYENEDGKIFYPFIKRKIDSKEGYFDIITPYGYGGPVLEGKEKVIEQFYAQFKEHCLDNNIITETIRCHPLLKNNEYLKDIMHVDFIRKTTGVDLTPSLEEIRRNYTSSNKRNIRKAKKEGVKVFVSNDIEDIEIFSDMYYETMDRNNALNFYYFNNSYFIRQMEETALFKPYILLAKYDGQIIGGVLILVGTEYAHYHLGASRTEYLGIRPNNLLFDAMVELSKSFNLKTLHLGGGYQENDSLFKFKASFTNNNYFNYYMGKNIVNQEIYNELCQIKIDSLFSKGQSNYFPLYRS